MKLVGGGWLWEAVRGREGSCVNSKLVHGMGGMWRSVLCVYMYLCIVDEVCVLFRV